MLFPIIKTQKLMPLLLTNISFATHEKNNLKLGQKFQNSKLIIHRPKHWNESYEKQVKFNFRQLRHYSVFMRHRRRMGMPWALSSCQVNDPKSNTHLGVLKRYRISPNWQCAYKRITTSKPIKYSFITLNYSTTVASKTMYDSLFQAHSF